MLATGIDAAISFGAGLWMTYIAFVQRPKSEFEPDKYRRFRTVFKWGGPYLIIWTLGRLIIECAF